MMGAINQLLVGKLTRDDLTARARLAAASGEAPRAAAAPVGGIAARGPGAGGLKPVTEGRKDDTDKVRIDLFPAEALFAISRVLTFGAAKYEDRNWEKGMKWGRVFGAAMRHAWSWWQGKGPTTTNFAFGEVDDESGFSHLWHLGCCVVFLIAYEERKVGEDDRPVG